MNYGASHPSTLLYQTIEQEPQEINGGAHQLIPSLFSIFSSRKNPNPLGTRKRWNSLHPAIGKIFEIKNELTFFLY